MKIGILGILVVLLSSVLVTAETADVDVLEQPQSQGEVLSGDVTAEQQLSDTPQYYYLSYSQNDIARSQQVLQNKLDILYYVYEHQYLVHASEKELTALQEQGYVLGYSLVRENRERFTLGALEHENLYYVYAFRDSDVPRVQEDLRKQGLTILDTNSYVTVLDLSKIADKEDVLRQMVSIEGVEAVEQRPHYEVLNDVTNVVVGTTNVRQRLGLYGNGQIIAIADTGLDTGVLSTLHPDIRGRVISLTDIADPMGGICQGTTNPNDPTGHGTAVTGTAIGNGLQSGSTPGQHSYPLGSYAGSAPEARLVFQAVGCDQGGISIPIPPETLLFPPAYQQGARIHSNSYSTNPGDGSYAAVDRSVDRYTSLNKDFLIVFGGGNANGIGTVGATAKNAIIVGGVIKDLPTTQIYARGPTKDGRYKPDILSVAGASGGAGVTTTRSSVQTVFGCQQLSTNPEYCYISGTSISTPNVAGAAALVREYYMTRRNVINPSAALVKATLLNGGDHMMNGLPDPNYGWGRLNLIQSFPTNMYDDFAFWDVSQGLATNGQKSYKIYVDTGKPLRITLDWTDKEACPEPGCSGALPKLVNDLDLLVIAPNGQQYNGNDLVAPYNDAWDRRNNVERVEIQYPVQGMYTVRVRAQNVPLGTQDFAMVASYGNLFATPAPLAQACIFNGVTC